MGLKTALVLNSLLPLNLFGYSHQTDPIYIPSLTLFSELTEVIREDPSQMYNLHRQGPHYLSKTSKNRFIQFLTSNQASFQAIKYQICNQNFAKHSHLHHLPHFSPQDFPTPKAVKTDDFYLLLFYW